jgi:hypothetical protein
MSFDDRTSNSAGVRGGAGFGVLHHIAVSLHLLNATLLA